MIQFYNTMLLVIALGLMFLAYHGAYVHIIILLIAGAFLYAWSEK
jgi:hypothetical protein